MRAGTATRPARSTLNRVRGIAGGAAREGGAYDTALACGRDPREAIKLMVAHGLTTRRTGPAERAAILLLPAGSKSLATERPPDAPAKAEVDSDERQLADASDRLAALLWPPRVLRPDQARVWSRATLLELGCGWERGRVTIPIRDGHGGLRGVLRYAPWHDRAPKVLAVRGTRLGLIPHPCTESSTWVVLVEGPPDMISARSRGLPAIAVPGDDAWKPGWARLLAGRHVSVVFDCDRAGRDAARRLADDLKVAGVRGSIVDLARTRTDGYDLTEWLAERESLGVRELRRALGAPDARLRAEVPAAAR